jgi:hypothetical protein
MKDYKDFPLRDLFGDLSLKEKEFLKKRSDDKPKKKKPDDFLVLNINKPKD